MIKKEDKKEEANSGTGYEDGQYILLFSTTARLILRHETNDETTHFRLLVRLQLDKQSDHQVGVSLYTGRVFLMTS